MPTPSPTIVRLLEPLDVPAMILTRCVQVVGWNPLCARLLFDDTDLAVRHRDWDLAARDIVGILRMTGGRVPENPLLQELVGELAVRNATFRRLGAERHIHERTNGPKPLRQPEVGDPGAA